MKLIDSNIQHDSELLVTFTGGLGAQIFSAAIYYDLKGKGYNVYADLDYFKKPKKTATVGNKGEVSHWNYELGEYGLSLAGFSTKYFGRSFFKRHKPQIISDGGLKIELAIEAIRQQEVKNIFKIRYSFIEECKKNSGGNDYLCIHIRRGDYVNVASYLIDDLDYANLAKSISNFVDTVIVISDSEVPSKVRGALFELFKNCTYIIGGNPHIAHTLMRQAKYLVCSNSQFSLSAALLNHVAHQVFLPTKWFGDIDSGIQVPINALCRFQLLNID